MLELSNINNNTISLSTNPVTVYMSSVSAGSRRTIVQSLKIITQMSGHGNDILNYPWHTLRYQHVQAIRTYLADKYHHNTANKVLTILKMVLRECKRLDLISAIDYDKAVDYKPVKGNSIDTGRYITPEEFDKIIAACDSSASPLRNKSIFYCLQVGLRRAEVSSLKLTDYSKVQRRLTVMKSKGNKSRIVPLTRIGAETIDLYLETTVIDGDYLFSSNKSKNGKLTDQSIYEIVKMIAELAGIEAVAVHDFRRSCASNLLLKKVDLVIVQKILGHESIKTTAKYDRRGIEETIKAIDLL